MQTRPRRRSAGVAFAALTLWALLVAGARAPTPPIAGVSGLPPAARVVSPAAGTPAAAGTPTGATTIGGGAQAPGPATPSGAPVGAAGTTTCNITRYGADPTGVADSTLAIRRAITVCEATAGPNTVSLPAGTYKLNLNDGGTQGSGHDLLIKGSYPIVFAGAGATVTRLVEWVGSKTQCGGRPCTPKNLLYNLNNGTRVTGLTLDTQTHDADRAFETTASNVTLDNMIVLGGDHSYAIRFNGGQGSSKTHPIRATGNVVHDVTLNDQSGATYAGFDFSFQQNAQISNITHTGSRLGLYVPSNVTVTNYTYTPGVQGSIGGAARGFFVTPPADHVTMTGFHSYGQGGVIAPDPTFRSNTVAISDERVYNATSAGQVDQLTVGDAAGMTIHASVLPRLLLSPDDATNGLTVTATAMAQVWCYPVAGATITDVSGVSCPTSTRVGSSKRAILRGQTVTLTATVSSTFGDPSGTATFFANGVAVGTVAVTHGAASLPISTLALGADVISVTYNGQGLLAPSTSGTITVDVD